MITFRETFQAPLNKTVMGLRSMVSSECPIEIQLRDPREHEWALAVERTGSRLGIGLKEGEGPADLREYFRLASDGIYMERTGQEPDPAFREAFDAARERAVPYFKRS